MTIKATVSKLFGIGTHPRDFESRRDALESAKKKIVDEHESARAALQAQLGKLDQLAGTRIAEAIASESAFSAELLSELVSDGYTAFGPLVEAWRAEPTRVTAARFADVLRTLLAREIAELGAVNRTPRVVEVLVFSFADLIVRERPNSVMTFGSAWPEAVGAAAYAVWRGARDASEAYDTIRTLERALNAVALGEQRAADERMTTRYTVRRTLDSDALERFDREHAAAAQARFERDFASAPLQGGVIDGASS